MPGLITIAFFGAASLIYYYADGAHRGTFTADAWGYYALLLLPIVATLGLVFSSSKKPLSFKLTTIVGYFFWAIFITSIYTFVGDSKGFGKGFVLFFMVLKFAILPLVLGIVFHGLGAAVLKKLKLNQIVHSKIKDALNLGIGWSIFSLTLATIGFFSGAYTLWTFYILLAVAVGFSYKEILATLVGIWNKEFSYESSHSPLLLKISATINSLFLMVVSVILSTNLVNIVRPYPIGWDDLGAYMNLPKLMAYTGSTSEYGITLWQTFTGIGFLHGASTLAFYLNSFGALLAIMAIWSGIRYFTNDKARFFSFPLFSVMFFLSLPMIIFQQAKDMKLDSGLLGISILACLVMFEAFKKEGKTRNILLIIAGALMGIAFSIKFTTLMLILAGFGLIWYRAIGLVGVLGFLGIFVGIFTRLHLWDFLNVNYPRDNLALLHSTAIAILVAGVLLTALGVMHSKEWRMTLKEYIVLPALFLSLGIASTLAPWFIKNIVEVRDKGINVGGLLNGDVKSFHADYNKILSPEEITQIQEKQRKNVIDTEGKTTNEDLGRYFGYEDGINNYLKLPINLTLQRNQAGEFTDISYLFLALLPGALLLKIQSRKLMAFYTLYLLGLVLYYFIPGSGTNISSFFANIEVPGGYLFIIAAALTPFLLVHLSESETIDKSESANDYRYLFYFVSLYTLLFVVAAFGIVWYGIFMYFGFLAILALCLQDSLDISSEKTEQISIVTGITLLMIITPYYLISSLPGAWKNLPQDSMEFKIGKENENQSIFSARPEYFAVLAELNIKDKNLVLEEIKGATTNTILQEYFAKMGDISLAGFGNDLQVVIGIGEKSKATEYTALAQETKKIQNLLFDRVLKPKEDNRNQDGIYRIGTFLTYYISENRSRFYEDSLILSYELYFKGKTIDESVDRMKKLGLSYLLVDLNAATIDQDPRRDLTRRYEEILNLMRSSRLKLIKTDSLCLQYALEKKTDPNYMIYAGVNYVSSFVEDGVEKYISPSSKIEFCASDIAKTIYEKKVTETTYARLKPLSDLAWSKNPTSVEQVFSTIRPYINRGWMAAFELTDTPTSEIAATSSDEPLNGSVSEKAEKKP